MTSRGQAAAALRSARDRLLAHPGVVGVGLSREGREWCVKVLVSELPAARSGLPADVDGVPVRIAAAGRPAAQG